MMEQILALIDNFLSDRLPDLGVAPSATDHEEWRFSARGRRRADDETTTPSALRTILRDNVFRGWVFSQASGQAVISQDVAGSDDFVHARAEEAGKAAKRHRTWHDFVDRLLDAYRCRLLVLYFDDCDLTPDIIQELLETIRLYLDHPRIVVLVAGHLDAIRMNLRVAALDRLSGIAPTFGALATLGAQEDHRASEASVSRRLVDTYTRLLNNRIEEADRYISKLLRPAQTLPLKPLDIDEATSFVFEPLLGSGSKDEAAIVRRIRSEIVGLPSASAAGPPLSNALEDGRLGLACDAFLWLLWRREVAAGLSLRSLTEVREHLQRGLTTPAGGRHRRALVTSLPWMTDDERSQGLTNKILQGSAPIFLYITANRSSMSSGWRDDLPFDIACDDTWVEMGRTSENDLAGKRGRAFAMMLLDQARIEDLTRKIRFEVTLAATRQSEDAPPGVRSLARGPEAGGPDERGTTRALPDELVLKGTIRHPAEVVTDFATRMAGLVARSTGAARDKARHLDVAILQSLDRVEMGAPLEPPSNFYLVRHLVELASRTVKVPTPKLVQVRTLSSTGSGRSLSTASDGDGATLSAAHLAALLSETPARTEGHTPPPVYHEKLRRYGKVYARLRPRHIRSAPDAGGSSRSEADAVLRDEAARDFSQSLDLALARVYLYRQRLLLTIDMALYVAGAVLAADGGPWGHRSAEGERRIAWPDFTAPVRIDPDALPEAIAQVERRLRTIALTYSERRERTLHSALPLQLVVAIAQPVLMLARLGASVGGLLDGLSEMLSAPGDWGTDPSMAVGAALVASTAPELSEVGGATAKSTLQDAFTTIRASFTALRSAAEGPGFGGNRQYDGRRLAAVGEDLGVEEAVVAFAAASLPTLSNYLQERPRPSGSRRGPTERDQSSDTPAE